LILPIILPVPQTPEPTGSDDVGTMTITLVDKSRKELYANNTDEPRMLNVQIWYPADLVPGDQPDPWLADMEVMGAGLADKLSLPAFFVEHVKYARANAVGNAALSRSRSIYPVLLFSHGWGGFKNQNTYQVEELASHGYIVVAPDHTYGAMATVLPDGRVALNNPEALPVGMNISDDEFMMAARVLGDQWAGDLSHILDYLENQTLDDPAGQLANHLDFTRIGVLGHSTGGGAAIQFCATDQRCKAGLGMDPYMDPVSNQILDMGIQQPFLAMFSESWADEEGRNNIIFEKFIINSNDKLLRYYIEDTEHYDFTDMPAFSPLAPYLGLKGTLDGNQVSKIINAYTLAFFERYLMNEPGILLDKPTPEFPEMIQMH
jgi:dienelactone hydrolase